MGPKVRKVLGDSPPVVTPDPLFVQQLLDHAQRAAQRLRIGSGPAQYQRSLKLGDHRIRCNGHGRHAMMLGDTRRSIDQEKRATTARGMSRRGIGRVFKSRPLPQL
jgi:hypothetical protein